MFPIDRAGAKDMLHIVEGKLARLTHVVPTLKIENSDGHLGACRRVPPSWLCLLRRVTRDVLCYREVVEAAAAKEHP